MSPAIQQLLDIVKTIAVVGISTKPERAAHYVPKYMQQHGYRIVPVNPVYAGLSAGVLGEACYPDLSSAAAELAAQGQRIDMVNVFRRSEDVPPVIKEAMALGLPALWLQLGIRHAEMETRAREAGMQVVSDRCLMVEHRRAFD